MRTRAALAECYRPGAHRLAAPGLLVALVACNSPTTDASAVGTIAYLAPGTGSVHVRDLATGADTVLDDGAFAGLALAPDAQHVAYRGDDETLKIADRTGRVMAMLGGGGCAGPARWVSPSALLYCTSAGTLILSALDATPRIVPGAVSISPDATTDAYIAGNGDLIVEDLAGISPRVLVPSPDPTRVVPGERTAGFTPDGRAVLVAAFAAVPNTLHVVQLASAASVDVVGVSSLGTSFGMPVFQGASAFSPDSSELLMQTSTALVAVTLATGAQRTIAAYPAHVRSGGAVFLDATHVLWVADDDESDGDIGRFYLSLHVAGPGATDDITLDDPRAENQGWNSIAVATGGVIAVPSDVLLVDPTGATVLANDTRSDATNVTDFLGVSPRGDVLGITASGDLRLLGADGANADLFPVAHGPNTAGGPAAAYYAPPPS